VTPSRIAAALRRRPKFNIIAVTLTVLIAVGTLKTADLWWRHQRALEAAETRATNMSFVLAEYIRGSFASADAAIRQLQLHGRRVGGANGSREDWEPMLASAKAALPESGSLSVTDASGTITHSTQRVIIGQPRRNESIFKQLSTAKADDLVVGVPFATQTTPVQHIVPVGRRLVNAAGAFDGTIVVSVVPERYREFFRTLKVGSEGAISVLHPEGVVLFREPSSVNPISESAEGNVLLKLGRERQAGVVHGPLVTGGRRFISAYRTIGSPPLIVAVSLSEREVLAAWRGELRVSITAFGALTLMLAFMLVLLFRTVSARERVEEELAEVQRLESERLRDANERLAAALEREQRTRKEVESASYLKDEFLMTVSHELRTPLTAIYGWARVLGTREMPKEEQARAIAAIERNAYAQTRLIDDLLDVSRAISGKLRLDARTVDVAEVLRLAIETVGPAMAAKGIRFESEFDPNVPPILADPDRLQQVAWNLLSNAIKFTPEGGAVRLRLAAAGNQVEITVSDTGSGIGPDFLPHVFERFRQAEAGSRRRFGGLGLGLAIVRHLVELHGGTVTAESGGEGQGATFRVSLPVRPSWQPVEYSAGESTHSSPVPKK
jgi:signal transduction histidine kinase